MKAKHDNGFPSRDAIVAFIRNHPGNIGTKEIAREFDALLIVDEMITGFGRTGKYWGSEHSGVEPDIITSAKGMANGAPIGATSAAVTWRGAVSWPASDLW